MITAEEFSERMKSIRANLAAFEYDEEIAHSCADSLMMETLTELGYGEGVEIFRNMPKWYA